jgi:hypothetical protein
VFEFKVLLKIAAGLDQFAVGGLNNLKNGSLDPFPQRARHALQDRRKVVLTKVDIQDAKNILVVTRSYQDFFEIPFGMNIKTFPGPKNSGKRAYRQDETSLKPPSSIGCSVP